jgi:type IV pilus assembly protein PilO
MLNSTKDEYTDILDRRNGIFRREDKTEKELITLKENKDDIYRKYFPSLDQAQILYMLNNMIENSEVKINDISFSPYSKEKIEGITFDYVDISLPYEGYYDGLMEILKNIGTSSKKLVITGLTIDRADDDAVKGDIFLRAYSIEGNDDENKDFVYME